MAAASGPRGEEREEEDDGCQKANTPSVPHVQVFLACEQIDEHTYQGDFKRHQEFKFQLVVNVDAG